MEIFSLTLTSSLAALAITIILSFISVGIYRAFFSSLAQIPGPRLWAATRIPMFYYLGTGNLPYKIDELHRKYGPVVRLAPKEVSFINAEAWNDIYQRFDNGRRQLQKDPLQFMPNTTGVAGLLFETDDAVHGRLRRNFSHAFSEKSMREQEPIIRSYIDKFIVKLHENAGKAVDMCKWYNFVSFDLIGDLVFGESFQCLEENKLHAWILLLIDWVAGLALMGYLMRFQPAFYLLQYMIPKHQREADEVHREMTRERMEKRLALKGSRNDFLDYVIKVLDTPSGISKPELLETCRILVTGGSETTASVLSGLTYYLLSSPSRLSLLKTEIRSAFTSADQINMASVNKLEYLLASINEGLRLFPPLPGNMRRYTPPEGSTIAGTFIPGNTMVAVDQYAAYVSPSHFHRPLEFIPERWLAGEKCPEEFRGDERKVVQAFSVGPRNCIGKNLAYMEMRLILARVLWEFDLELIEGEEKGGNWRERVKALGFWVKPSLMVRLVPVKRG